MKTESYILLASEVAALPPDPLETDVQNLGATLPHPDLDALDLAALAGTVEVY
jgi:hypothetical protein